MPVRALRSQRGSTRAASPEPPAAAAAFARRVEREVRSPVLRYSQRLHLLREAERQGIGRFEANLIIATVQHRARRAESERTTTRAARGRRILWPASVACLTQLAVFTWAWWVLG